MRVLDFNLKGQSSGPKRDVIGIAEEVDGELVVKQVYAVRKNEPKKRVLDRFGLQRGADAIAKRLRRRERNMRNAWFIKHGSL